MQGGVLYIVYAGGLVYAGGGCLLYVQCFRHLHFHVHPAFCLYMTGDIHGKN